MNAFVCHQGAQKGRGARPGPAVKLESGTARKAERFQEAWKVDARALGRGLHQSTSPTVALITSSGVVKPASTFRLPSSRNERIPISKACARKTEEGTLP